MAFRDSLKKYREAQGSQSTASSTHSGSTEQTTSGSGGSGGSFRDSLQKYRMAQTYTSSLEEWDNEIRGLLTYTQDRTSKWFDNAEYNSLYDRYNKLLAQADGWRKRYAGDEKVTSYIDSVVSSLETARKYSSDSYHYFSQWENEEGYNTARQKQQEYYDKWGHYADEADFEEYSAKGAAIENPDTEEVPGWLAIGSWNPFGKDPVNKVTYTRDNWDKMLGPSGQRFAQGGTNQKTYQINDLYLEMTDDEVAIYNYLLAKEGKETAQNYLDELEETLSYRKGTGIAKTITGIDNDIERAFTMGIFGLGAGLDQFGSGVQQFVSGEKQPTSFTQFANAQVADSIDGFGKYAYTATTTIGNMAPSILVGAINPIAGAATMGVSAAGNAYGQALNDGYSKLQARTYSTLVGAAEGALQYLLGGIGKLGGASSAKILSKVAAIDNSLLRIAAKLGVELGSEIVEEEIQNYLEPAFRSIIFGEKYDAPTIDELIETAIVTAISTGVLEGGGTVTQDVADSRYYKDTYGNVQRELVDEALEIDPDYTYAQKQQSRLDGGKNLSGHQLGRIVQQNEATLTAQDMAAIQSATESRLAELGETGDVKSIAAALTKQAAGQKLSRSERQAISGSQYAQRVANELNTENIRSGEYSSSWAENIDTQRINVDEYSRLVEAAQQPQEAAETTGEQVVTETPKAVQTVQTGAVEAPAATNPENQMVEKSADDKTYQISSGKEVMPQKVISISNGKAIIQTDNGKISAEDIAFGNADMDLLWRSAVQFNGINPAGANGVIRAYQGSIPVATYLTGAAQEFKNGYHNFPSGGQYADKLTQYQRTIIYELGQKAAGENTAKAQSNVDTVYAEAEKILEAGKKKKGSSYAVLEDNISRDQLNEAQEAIFSLADEIAQSIQTNIHVYAGTNSAQGFYNHTTDEIWLNLNAAVTSREHIMAFTLAHEIVHRSKKGSPAKYKAFVNFLMKEYGKQGSDVDKMIAEQIDAAERFNKTVPDSKKVNMTQEKALEEVACDACQRMFMDTNAGQKLAEFGAQSNQNKSFLEDLKKWISELMDKLRSFFKNVEPDSLAAKEFAKFDANVKQILADMYVDMAIESGEKLSTIKAAYGGEFAQKFLNVKDISYNLAATENHKTKLQKEYSEDSSTDLETIMARYDKIIDIWTKLGGELNSKFLADWNSKIGKDRTFTIFKAQAGYKYNVELSSMCKKGVPLFEAIDTIVKQEVMKELEIDVLGKAEKEILYDILKQHSFEIPCAICYVEQARQREGVIIDAFLNGKVETNAKGVTTKAKLGWNQVLDTIQKEMKANGVNYSFAQVSRDIATEKYTPANLDMDIKTQAAFYAALKKVANQEISRYNKAEGKNRKLLAEVTPEAVKECFKGTLPSNLKIFKVLFEEPSSRFKIQKDLLYSSVATQNLSMAHNKLYGLFNSQGGVSGYKTKQGTTIYWGDILGKSWKPDTLRNEGGVRNQSNSDFQMYTLLDQAQMYIDFTAKGYYLQAYTKVLSELKLFGLSRGKINASLIPKVVVYRNADGSVDIEKTMANAGLDENGNPLYDDIEGINHDEAFMLIEDPEYSKSICGICIGYSDDHINKLLDDPRVQQIIGFHDKTDDGSKRYKGARYAKNYNGLNEAVNKEGKTVHIGFNPYVKRAEKKFKFNAETETYEGTVNYNGKTYTADDIPRLATALYLEMCAKKEYTPAYKDFVGHRNYYKLLADFGLYDSQGHYAPHRKVVYNMPDTVPYLDANGKKQTMSTYDYIKTELVKELAVRDSISEALADTSDDGIIPQFKAAVKNSQEEKSFSLPKIDSDGNQLSAEQQEFFKNSVVRDADGKLMVMYHGTANGGAFTVFDGDKLGDDTRTTQVGQGFYFTNVKKEAESYMKNVDIYGRVSRGKNPHLHQVYLDITNPFNVDSDKLDIDKVKSVYMDGTNDYFFDNYIPFYLNNKTVNGRTFTKAELQAMSKTEKVSAYVDFTAGDLSVYYTKMVLSNMVRAFPYGKQSQLLASMKNRLGYDGIVEEFKPGQYQYVAFSSEQVKAIDNQNPTTDPDIRYSLPKGEPVPTFYSHMARVVDGVKQEKLGASSVVSMLRGKGVKAEEIKWSGIEAFLDGKKSVTKAELQEFITGSMLQIEEEILDNKDRPYTEDQQKRLNEYEAKRDEVAKQIADEWKRITGEDFPIRNAGAGLESAVSNAIVDFNLGKKKAAFEGRLLEKLRKDLEEVIKNNDDFGFDSWKDALRSIHRHRRDFIKNYEMSTNDKTVIVKYCNALNAYNELPNSISDADTDRLRAIAREADPWNRKIMEVKHEHNEKEAKFMTNWGQYRLKGGKNYREMLFRIPGSTYSNEAMFTHWKERKGVLAHARIQDMDTFIGNMLFIEEIQSDWHNAGHKAGYRDPSLEDKHTLSQKMEKYTEDFFSSPTADMVKERIALVGYEGAGVSMILNFLIDSQESMQSTLNTLSRKGASFTESEVDEIAKYAREYEELYHKWETAPGDLTAPDAPFKDTYHEYVMKRLIRIAAEQDYDSIGWTTADVQMERWNPSRKTNEQMGITDAKNPNAVAFEDGYRIEYDQDIPKFLRRYGKQWDTTVGKTVLDNGTEVWSMAITDSMKDSVLYEGQVMYSLPKVAESPTYEELVAKKPIAVIGIGQNEDSLSYAELKDIVLKGARERKIFDVPHPNRDTKVMIFLTEQSFTHAFSNLTSTFGEDTILAMGHIPELIHEAVLTHIASPKNPRKAESRVFTFFAAIEGKNGIEPVKLTVKEYVGRKPSEIPQNIRRYFEENGEQETHNRLYDAEVLEVIAIEGTKKESGASASVTSRKNRLGAKGTPNSTIKITDLLGLVNGDAKKYIPLPVETKTDQEYMDAVNRGGMETAQNKLPIGEDTSPRALLANAFEGIITNDIEKRRLEEYKGKVEMLNAEEQKLRELRAEIKELSFAKGKRDTKKIKELQFEAIHTANRITTLDKMLLRLEAAAPLQSVLQREKEMAYKRAEMRGKEALEAYKKAERERDKQWQSEVKGKYQESKKKAIETRDKREAREKLQKLVLDTVKWITYPSKTDVKCPDILKQPYSDFLNSIDLSSQRLAKGGDPTKNDLRLASAMSSLATALERVMVSQDPNQDATTVLDTGYLDLPANFVQILRDMTEDVKAMMGGNEYVVNNMPAAEVRKLTQMIRTLNHAIKEVSTLYANLRFANVEALGDNTMSFVDALGEIEKTGGVKDFVQWDNALPYYAFKRFGEGGESIFEGLMDAQDKLAFLAQKIFDFREKAWTDKEAKTWSEDTHTINLPNGSTLTLTTADAMSIYCLSRRQHGLQHLLVGGARVIGLQKGSQKAKDSRSLLTANDISAITSSLTDRQKQVAESIQEFMSTVCSEWGNEISMKRFMTKEFNEKFYFPIESNDENLSTKDPSAQQSDLFRLLNISATKPIDPRANNEVIIRNVFDVFTNHAADMARLNAYGMALLDYMKWLNYREKTVNEEGQINVRGVRKSMERAYGAAAKSYVLNLVKDVNGRPSDGGIPSFYTRMLRNAKTAMVGNSLRVATLQITSYPRAALVLSPKNLALGLSKLPKIEKAKKYCGIALWKSFGFYDTNIARSIEDQIKGVKNVKQKLIELSLKGAEIGDAITWGALWNACEYEVAATKKYKVGTEEFYQEVGKKLREVVYRTQVVDSTLTRSEMMRSKNAKAQELSAFMSEPTLSANILMDAGFEFHMEKRRTGNIKVAWKKTGKYITRAIAVYSIGQLAAALLEGLWDAWRDDEDKEFGEKFLKAFIENGILDLLPFNKVPIISDLAEAALSLIGLGYFSSDSLSSTGLSQMVSAAKAWSDVLNGNTSETTYSAIYKTMRAISSFLGVSASGAMREVVALWNNTAGAYDITWKIRTWDLSKTNLAGEALDAIIAGNDRQANSIRAEFTDEDSYQSAMRTAIKDRYAAGVIDYDTAIQYLVKYGGMEEDDAYWKAEEWMYESETGEDYGKYDEFFTAVQTGKNLKAVIKKYTDNGVELETLSSQITNHYKPMYIEMSTSEKAGIKGYLLNAFEQCGVTREDATKKLQYWEFLSEQPDSDLNQYQVADYYEFAKPAGISAGVYTEYCNKVKGIEGEDKKARRMAVIHSLPLSTAQKDALYYAEGWAASRIYEAPWH